MHEDIPILNFLVPKEFTHENGKLTGVAVREGEGRIRRQGPPQAGADRRAGPALRLRRRAGRGRPGERVPLDRARHRHRVRQVGHAEGRSEDHGLDQPEGVLRRRRGVRPEEHHLGGGARPRRRAVDRQDAAPARTSPSGRCPTCRSSARRWASTSGATTTTFRTTSATACRIATRSSRCATSRPRSNSATTSSSRSRKRTAASTAMCRRCSRRSSASSATPASTSARWTASPSRENGEEADLRTRLQARRPTTSTQDLYVANGLKTGRVMVKDEDVCLHCGLCAERCPTGAWDMQKYLIDMTHAGRPMPSPKPDQQRKRLRRPVRQRQRLRLGQRQRAVRALDPAHGRAGLAAQHLPVQHPGPADLVRGARHRGRPSRRARRRRPDGGDEPADLRQGRRLDRARRLSVLRFHQAAAGVEIPRRHHRHRRAADRNLQHGIHRSAPAPAVQEHHLCRRAVGAARHGRAGDREAARRAVQGQGKAARRPTSTRCISAATGRWPISTCPIGLRVQHADKVGDRIFIEGNRAAALGAVYGGATVCAWYPITPSSSLADAFTSYCKRLRARSRDQEGQIRHRAGARTNSPRSAW